jgi:hypothetical protein
MLYLFMAKNHNRVSFHLLEIIFFASITLLHPIFFIYVTPITHLILLLLFDQLEQ